MRKGLVASAAILLIWSWAMPVSAESIPDRTDPRSESGTGVEGSWDRFQQAITREQFAQARLHLDEVREILWNRGTFRQEVYALGLVEQARRLYARGDFDHALEILRVARELAPSYGPVYYAVGEIYWKKSGWYFLRTLDAYLLGLSSELEDFTWTFAVTGRLLLLVALAIAFGFLLFLLFATVRYLPLLVHDLSERLPEGVSASARAGLWPAVVFVLVLPLLFRVGILWLLLVLAFLLWVYMNRRERIVTVAFFVFLLVSPLTVRTLGNVLAGSQHPWVKAMATAQQGEITTEVLSTLRQAYGRAPADETVLFALALAEKRVGLLEEARQHYLTLLGRHTRDARAANNLGNVFVGMGDLQGALEAYRRAVAVDPHQVTALYNLSQVHRELLQFEEGERRFQEARTADADRVNAYRKLSGVHYNRFVMDEHLTHSELFRKAVALADSRVAEDLWGGMVSGVGMGHFPFVLFPYIVGLAAYHLSRSRWPLGYACRRCGRVGCRICQSLSKETLCSECYQVLIKMEGVEARGRIKKILEIRKHQDRRVNILRLLSFLLPGSGHFYVGAPLHGFLFAVLVIFGVLTWLFWSGVLIAPANLGIATPLFWQVAYWAMLVALYFGIVRHAYQLKV